MRWRILALLFAARVSLGVQFQTMASVGDDLVAAYGFDYAGIGLLIGLFMIPGLFLAIPAGFAGVFASDRVLAALGLGALALGGMVSAVWAEAWSIGSGRLIAGAGFLLSTLFFTKMISDWFSGREIATAMSVLVMSWPLGIAIGQVGHEWLAQLAGWRAPFLVASACCAAAAIGVMALYRPVGGLAGRNVPAASHTRGFGLTGQEWRLIILSGAAWGLFNAGYVVYLSYGPLILQGQGDTAFQAAATISIGSWLMIFSGTLCGWIVDRTGRRGLVLGVCMAGAILSLFILTVPGGGLVASLLFGLIGMAPAGLIMALVGEAVRPERRAIGMGIFFTIYYGIMAAAPPGAGLIFDATSSGPGIIILAVALFAAVFPLVCLFRLVRERGARNGDLCAAP